jgi:hypothetical protein
MSDFVFAICSMPRNFHVTHNKSMVQLLKESGYYGLEELLTKDRIIKTLNTCPYLVNDWLVYSADKRVQSGWYFSHSGSQWTIGCLGGNGSEEEQVFDSADEACAAFIFIEVHLLAEYSHY